MLLEHMRQGNDALLIVDSDCDGYTSAALLINYLSRIDPEYVTNHISYWLHSGKQHGVNVEVVEENFKLVIVPDAGSNDFNEHQVLHNRDVDVLIIDHHLAETESEYACVINNQMCDYKNKTLSGVGVTYKFCSYLDKLLKVNYANDFLDLVAIGIVADVMDLRDFETRHLITLGVNNIKNPFIKEMVKKQAFSLKGPLTPFGIGFYIAPYINAAIRVGSMEDKYLLFESMLDSMGNEMIVSTKRGARGELETRAEQACRTCVNLKNYQTKERDSALEKIEKVIEEKNLLDNKILIIPLDEEGVDKNLTGLIANQLMAKYQRPVLLLNWNDDLKRYEGSARGYDKDSSLQLKDFVTDTELINYAQGHQQAFGISINEEHLKPFIEDINLKLKDVDFSPSYKVDFIFNNNTNINKIELLELASLKYLWGQGIDEPLIAVEGIEITDTNIKLMSEDKNPTIKITLSNGISIIKFKSSKEEFQKLNPSFGGHSVINIVGRCEMNNWNGNITPQILVEDYEIVERKNFYF